MFKTFLNIKQDLAHGHGTFEDLVLCILIFDKKLSAYIFLKICTAFMEDFKFPRNYYAGY